MSKPLPLQKIFTLYLEGGTNILPSHTLVLDVIVQYKVLVKNLTPEDVQTVFANGHVVDQQL